MARKSILILGASGLTGYKAAQLATKRGFSVCGTYNMRRIPMRDMEQPGVNYNDENRIDLVQLDLNKENELKKIIRGSRPDIILNCTALHNVDYCESHPLEAFYINCRVVELIAGLANNMGSRLLQISTDFVFGGEKRMYSEDDHPNPLSVYAKSKFEGETAARNASSYAILRPSVVYGWTPIETQGSLSSSGKPVNFALWVLYKMKDGEEIRVVDDQYTSPTLADTLADIAVQLGTVESNDLFHVAGTSCMSRYEFSRRIAEIMGYGKEDSGSKIKPIKSTELTQKAMRPMHSCLKSDKIQKELNLKLLDVDESLHIMKSQVEKEAPHLLDTEC